MKIIAIQHDAADPPAMAGEIALQLGHEITTIRLDRGDKIPTTADADMLMSFGGGISLTNDEQPDWVAAEQQLIRQYADSGRRVLGICLGSQMVATALGATVRRNREPEVGWHNIYRVETAKSAIANLFPESQRFFTGTKIHSGSQTEPSIYFDPTDATTKGSRSKVASSRCSFT